MDFREADRRYAELKKQYEAGALSVEEFDEQRRQLMVQDDEERWWAKGRETDEWFYRTESGWVRGTPPVDQLANPEDQQVRRKDSPEQAEQEPPEQTEQEPTVFRPRRRTGLWVGSGIFVATVVLIGLIVALANSSPNPRPSNPPPSNPKSEDKMVPEVKGKTLSQAAKAADQDDLTIKVLSVDSRSEKKGTIYDQDPAAKTKASKGSSVDVKVSGGSGQVKVPNVKGKSKAEAVEKIIGEGLDTPFYVEIDANGKPNTSSTKVSDQNPPAGKQVNAGAVVTVE